MGKKIHPLKHSFIHFEMIISNHITAKITQCLWRWPRAGSVSALSQYRSAVLKRSSRRREQRRKKMDSPWGREKQLISAPKSREGCHVLSDELKRLDVAWSSGIFHPAQTNLQKHTVPPHREGDGTVRQEGRTDRCQERMTYVTEGTQTSCKKRRDELRHQERSIKFVLAAGLLWTSCSDQTDIS